MPSLTRAEAHRRSELLTVTSMDVDLDLDRGAEAFGSRTRIEVECAQAGATTVVDVLPVELASVRLNGRALEVDSLADGRLELTDLQSENVLDVEATMAYSR